MESAPRDLCEIFRGYSPRQFATTEELQHESDDVLLRRPFADPDRTISLGGGSTFTSWRNSKECRE